MGCFSFICKECGDPVLSDSFSGQPVKLFLLKEGKVIQDMEGQYDSYGRVFNKEFTDSIQWNKPWSGHDLSADEEKVETVCDLMFDNDRGNGIAAIHCGCLKEGMRPVTRSNDDPNQGWGE